MNSFPNPNTIINYPNNYVSFVNNIELTNDKTNCNIFNSPNNFGNYFKQCSTDKQSALWGSNKPVPDNCMKPHEGIPCHSIWNNLTRRKGIVEYKR